MGKVAKIPNYIPNIQVYCPFCDIWHWKQENPNGEYRCGKCGENIYPSIFGPDAISLTEESNDNERY